MKKTARKSPVSLWGYGGTEVLGVSQKNGPLIGFIGGAALDWKRWSFAMEVGHSLVANRTVSGAAGEMVLRKAFIGTTRTVASFGRLDAALQTKLGIVWSQVDVTPPLASASESSSDILAEGLVAGLLRYRIGRVLSIDVSAGVTLRGTTVKYTEDVFGNTLFRLPRAVPHFELVARIRI